MTKSSTFAKGALAAAVSLAALAAAATASAQPAYSNYNACDRDAGNRGITGALVGGGIGAVVGSQAAANHHRTDGSLLGGALGALAGAVIGHNTASCNNAPPPPPPGPVARYDGPPPPLASGPGPLAYEDAPPPPPAYYDGPPPPPPGPAIWVYGRHGVRYRVIADRMDRDGCGMAEAPIYFPDGRVDRRFVHVCPDYRGRYHVVD